MFRQLPGGRLCDSMVTNFLILAEQNDSQHMIQNIKKICTDSSSDETTPRRNQQSVIYRTTDVSDPQFKIPFKYGWKRELVSFLRPVCPHIFITMLRILGATS